MDILKFLIEDIKIKCKSCSDIKSDQNVSPFITCGYCCNTFCFTCLIKTAVNNGDIFELDHLCASCGKNKIHFEFGSEYKQGLIENSLKKS